MPLILMDTNLLVYPQHFLLAMSLLPPFLVLLINFLENPYLTF
jgi:hypothetical protein